MLIFGQKNYLTQSWKLDNQYCHIREALDNNSNERQSFDDEKIQLENECSELKEKLDHLISEFSHVNEKSKQQDVELMQTNEELCETKEKAEQNKDELMATNKNLMTKGQLISKCPFVAIVSSKIPTKCFQGFLPLPLKSGQITNKDTLYD